MSATNNISSEIIMNGFNNLSITEELLPSLFKAINSLTETHIESFYAYILTNSILPESIKTTWTEQRQQYANDKFDEPHYGSELAHEPNKAIKSLIQILKAHNKDYYNETIEPLLPSKENFKNSDYTIESFQRDFGRFNTLREMINKLKLCVAINTHGGYLIKTRSEEDNKTIQFQDIKAGEIKEYIGNLELTYQTTEKQQQKMREQKKAIKEKAQIKVIKVLTTSEYYNNFEKYDGVSLLTSNQNVLQLYNSPAQTVYDRQLIIDWIEFIKGELHNPEAFDELLDSHAYRFRNPDTFIEKFFINYGNGHNGKSYLVACLATMYPGFNNTATTQDQIERDSFTAWIVRNLLVWMEEAETSNYQSKAIQQRVKQLTTKAASSRGMYKEVKSARNWAIFGMNTNQRDLYGLSRGDPALLSRLVILDFKDNDRENDQQKRNEFDEKCKSFITNPNFAYSLYHYLSDEHEREIRKGFSPVRYYGKDKDDFLKNCRFENKNSVEDWFSEKCSDNTFCRINEKKAYVYIKEKEANKSYNNWKENHKQRLCADSIKPTFEKLGFTYTSTTINGEKGVRIFKMDKDKFDEVVKRLVGIEDDGEEIDECDKDAL